MPPVYCCTCVTRKCGQYVDPDTGVKGNFISSRALRDHQLCDKTASIHRLAMEVQSKALQAQEDSIAAALAAAPPPNQDILATTTSSAQGRYRTDGVRKIVSFIGEIHDVAQNLRRAVDAIGPAPITPVSNSEVREALLECSGLRSSVASQLHSLALTTRGVYRKDSSIKFLRDQVNDEFKQLSELINDTESSWDAVAKRHEAEREANRAKGVVDHNSGTPLPSRPPF